MKMAMAKRLQLRAESMSVLATGVAVACLGSCFRNIIGVELENPFGEDTNDLPAAETHEQFRRHILLLSDPGAWQVPRTKDTMSYGFEELRNASGRRVSLKQHLHSTGNLDSHGHHGPDLAKDMKATDTAGAANGPGPQNPQTSPKSHGPGHEPGVQSHHGGEHFFADPKQVEILERWLSRQSSMLESFLTKQQALMEQMLRFRNVEARAWQTTNQICSEVLSPAGEGFERALGLHSRGLLLHQRDATEARKWGRTLRPCNGLASASDAEAFGLKPGDHPDGASQAAAAPEARFS
ncbi:unnamed protein product [Symbiodinium sp. CCMP2456]|nr:unnamed protein product [Symbiodinium sp. CCMP2456]